MSYTGIGSRETPYNVLLEMTNIGKALALKGYILRSGAAAGADTAFERGCDLVQGRKEIYIPWKGFQGSSSQLYYTSYAAMDIAEKFHPAWNKCSQGVKKLHARNVYQILGQDLKTPTDFVICWTVGGKRAGGTGQALRIAEHYGIKIYDLAIDMFTI